MAGAVPNMVDGKHLPRVVSGADLWGAGSFVGHYPCGFTGGAVSVRSGSAALRVIFSLRMLHWFGDAVCSSICQFWLAFRFGGRASSDVFLACPVHVPEGACFRWNVGPLRFQLSRASFL
jgi:hypothetical protein